MEQNEKTRRIKRPNVEKLDREYNIDHERTKLAGRVTGMLIFTIIWNTIATTIMTFSMGFGVIALDDITYVSFLVSSIGIIGVTSLIVRLLPEKRRGILSRSIDR